MINKNKIYPCVIGLGYVGLPIFQKLSKKFKTCGFDIEKKRINELKKKYDRNLEFKTKDFTLNFSSFLTFDQKKISNSNFYIITVPTPIFKNKKPNLKYVINSFNMLSKYIKKGDIIILESTVYPGATEEFSNKILNKNNKNLILNRDFFIGYSPERINPGDKKHSLSKIEKIVAFKDKKLEFIVKKIYKNLGKKIIFSNKIKETETAKVVENIQRDLNIAFINEIFIFCKKLKLDFREVMRLASSKWNFLNFKPGLVGGHCLPVDPYYFYEIAKKNKYKCKVTLAGREVNNGMTKFISSQILSNIKKNKTKAKILIAGLTYKPDVPDIRNSLAIQVYKNVKKEFKNVDGYDPLLNKSKINNLVLKRDIKLNEYSEIYILTNHSYFNTKKFKIKKVKRVFQDL